MICYFLSSKVARIVEKHLELQDRDSKVPRQRLKIGCRHQDEYQKLSGFANAKLLEQLAEVNNDHKLST